MHEMALAEGILAVVLNAAHDEPVRSIRVRVGTLQAVCEDSLRFSFQLAAEGTCAAQAVLTIDEVPARVRCNVCSVESGLGHHALSCPSCGSPDIELLTGEEVRVDAVELDGAVIVSRPTAGDDTIKTRLKDHQMKEHPSNL